MFDIGFWEMALIAVVALLIVGPEEFPALVRNVGGWLGKLRSFMSETRAELDREFLKAEELKKRIEQEIEIAELHQQIDPGQPAVARQPSANPAADEQQKPDHMSSSSAVHADPDAAGQRRPPTKHTHS